ncbi:MFS transporter [Nocardioides sp. SYSU DS0663]|uniref:MFS transporter n=1 Tax=Nocardioides sp. SYSU DS0663 TaxID=3416445 RepID=UPI003F4C6AB1
MTVEAGARSERSGVLTAVAGMLLIAATYGMARFGVGLFAPALAAERPQLVEVLGWAAGAQFASYCVAAVAAGRFVDRRPRWGLALAGTTATAGCLGVAFATHPATFVVAVVVGGAGGGFASPAVVRLVDAVVGPGLAATAQSLANAGTAVGVIGSGLVAASGAGVVSAWLLLGSVCAAATAAAWFPARGGALGCGGAPVATPEEGHRGAGEVWRALALPAGAAFVAGAGSSFTWTFGPLVVSEAGAVTTDRVGWLWIALGAGGLLGTFTGGLVERAGRRGGWCTCAAVLALASAGVACAVVTTSAWVAHASMALFGAGYMGLSAVLILWARGTAPGTAGGGTAALLVALATGQAAGSVGFGAAGDAAGPVLEATVAAGLCVVGGLVVLVSPPGRRPRTARLAGARGR